MHYPQWIEANKEEDKYLDVTFILLKLVLLSQLDKLPELRFLFLLMIVSLPLSAAAI